MKILWWNTPYNQLLHMSLVFAVVPWLYSYFNEQHRKQSYSVEQAVMLAWDRVITQPTMLFRRVVIGFVLTFLNLLDLHIFLKCLKTTILNSEHSCSWI